LFGKDVFRVDGKSPTEHEILVQHPRGPDELKKEKGKAFL
jgi:hypothetical protein